MSLATGTKLGPYEIIAPLGAGGMGEVYKANDTRLDRTVAIKILPAALAADPDFKARFEREARSISALNHPNICTLFDVGSTRSTTSTGSGQAGTPQAAGGPVVDYLVMEYLAGETLAARLERGALPLADALKIATEIGSALDKAHRLGIVHRDLKPGNIMLVKPGGARSDATQAKLLDFGLAKIGPTNAVSQTAPTALATSPRPTAQALTAQGTILGTFQYMAPEQIDGEEADARTDIFAFGAVLFERLTGRKAFAGKSQASLRGRHVLRRADGHTAVGDALRHALLHDRTRNADIQGLGLAALVELDAPRLQNPVDDPEPVRLGQALAHLLRDADRGADAELPRHRDHALPILARHVLHRQEAGAAVAAAFLDSGAQ